MSQSLSAQRLALILDGLLLPMGLVVDEVRLEADEFAFDVEERALTLPSPGALVARVGEASIVKLLEAKAPSGLEGFEVKLEGGFIHATAVARVIIPIRGAARCALRIEDGARLMLDVVELDVPAVGRGLVESQMEDLNPIFDVSDLPIPARVRLESVSIDGGWIELRGAIEGR